MSELKNSINELFANEPEGRVRRIHDLANVLVGLQPRVGIKHIIRTEDGGELTGTLVKVSSAGCHFVDEAGNGFVAEGYHSGIPTYQTLAEVEDNVSLYHPMQGFAYPSLKQKYGSIPDEELDQNDQSQNLYLVMKTYMRKFVAPALSNQPTSTALTNDDIIDILVERLPASHTPSTYSEYPE